MCLPASSESFTTLGKLGATAFTLATPIAPVHARECGFSERSLRSICPLWSGLDGTHPPGHPALPGLGSWGRYGTNQRRPAASRANRATALTWYKCRYPASFMGNACLLSTVAAVLAPLGRAHHG